MSTVRATNFQNAGSATTNLVLDTAGNATVANTLVMGSSFLRNRIINGDMRIDQRNAGASVTVNAANQFYPVDRFNGYGQPADGVFTLQQVTDAPTGFRNSIKATVTTADASIGATQTYFVQQRVEGYNIADFMLGTSSTQQFTLSFWVKCSVTGTFGGSVGNNVDLSNPFNYTINSANTWEYKTVTFTSPASGTWNSTTGVGLLLCWSLGMGSSQKGTAGTWANYPFAPTGSVDLISTLNATWYITGVQLEAGTVATPFERRQYGQELVLCQRYYEAASNINVYSGQLASGGTYYQTTRFSVPKRTHSVVVGTGDTGSAGFPAGAPTVAAQYLDCFEVYKTANATQTGYYNYNWTANAEL